MSGTRQKTLGEQLSQTLVAEGRGEALEAEAEDAEPLMAKPAPESPALAEQLMEEVCDRGNLERAWKRVRSNKGSPGVDGMTIDAAKDYLCEHWPDIRAQLLEGTSHGGALGQELTWGSFGSRAIHSGMCQTPRAVSVSEVRARLHDAARFRARSTSHTVAARDGCTNIPLAAGRGSGTKPFYQSACRAMVTIGSSTRIRQN